MIRECPTVTTALVHMMIDRVRRFTSNDLQDEKMISLGKLSAGLAHELNNPASAASRSARLLAQGLADLEDAARALGTARLTHGQLEIAQRSRTACVATATAGLSPVERADREEAIASWLEAHGAQPDAASALLDTALTFEDFDALAAALDGDTLNTALRWLAADCSTRSLATEVERSVTRIHDLVAAIKRFTYMDRTSAPEPVDLSISLNDTVALLQHKARRKSLRVSVDLKPDLPRVRAIGSDLNQIWTNLIDNAIDAVGEAGEVAITAGAASRFRDRPHRRQRARHSAEPRRTDLRSVLHDQAGRARHRPRPRHRAPVSAPQRRRYRIRVAPRPNGVPGYAAGRRRRHGSASVIADGETCDSAVDDEPDVLKPGVFAAGDARHGSGKRVASAVGEGPESPDHIKNLSRFRWRIP